MNNQESVVIKEFKHIGSDDRGLTKEFSLPRQQQGFIYITRKKGTLSGNHYHTGKTVATSPKTFILLGGEIELSYRPVNSEEKNTIAVSAPALIEVQPNIIHAVKALADIIMLECNSISDIKNDSFKEAV